AHEARLNCEDKHAALTTLEERPAASLFVLVTDRPDVLLPTVRSRCQRLRFGPLPIADVAAVLMQAHGRGAQSAHAPAAPSDGSIGRALEGSAEDAMEARDVAARLLKGTADATDPRRRLDGGKLLLRDRDRNELAPRPRAR